MMGEAEDLEYRRFVVNFHGTADNPKLVLKENDMAMARNDYDFLAKIMKEQVDACSAGSLGENIRIQAFRLIATRIDAQYLNFKLEQFSVAAGIIKEREGD